LDRDYKIEHTSYHSAKFRGDRPTEHDLERGKNKCQQNMSAPKAIASRLTNNKPILRRRWKVTSEPYWYVTSSKLCHQPFRRKKASRL